MEIYNKNKSICAKAFREIYADNGGRYRLCCHAKPFDTKANEKTTQPFDFFLSEAMEDIRQKMIEGELIPQCATCHKMEEINGDSYRIRHSTEHWIRHGLDDEVRNVTVKVRLFGSFCNLSCVMCHPVNSSERRRELSKIFTDDEGKRILRKSGFTKKNVGYKKSEFDSYVEHINKHIHLISKFQMIGGETLQLPKYWEFLDSIPEEHAKRIRVSQETNLSKLGLGNRHIKEYADKFSQLHVGVSVDHFGIKNEYIRYPIIQNEFEYNLKELISYNDKIRIRLNATVSILNIEDLFEIEKYYKENFNKKIYFENIVRGPYHLSIRQLPEPMKQKYIEKYKDHYPYVISEIMQPRKYDYDHYNLFLTYMDRLFLYRGLEWRHLWKDLIDEYGSYEN